MVMRVLGAIYQQAQTAFERGVARTPSGRTEFFEPADFPWIADVEARAGEIKEELDCLLANVDQLPNFQDIQEEQRTLTQDDGSKSFIFYQVIRPASMPTAGDARVPLRSSNRSPA